MSFQGAKSMEPFQWGEPTEPAPHTPLKLPQSMTSSLHPTVNVCDIQCVINFHQQMGCIWAKEECGWSKGCASYIRPCLECLCWLSLRRNSCWLIDSGCAYTSVGPEKRGCLWASWERPGAPQGVLVKSVTLYRLALAGDASFGRCRCAGNKISLTRKAALFTWPTEISEEWRYQDL